MRKCVRLHVIDKRKMQRQTKKLKKCLMMFGAISVNQEFSECPKNFLKH